MEHEIKFYFLNFVLYLLSCVGDTSTGCVARNEARRATDDSVPRVSGNCVTAGRRADDMML